MDIFWVVLFVGLMLVVALAWWSYWLTQLWFLDSQKASPYECGFDPFGSARAPFSIRFYIVAILFLVFEVESLMLFPILSAYKQGVRYFGFYSWGFFIIIVLGLLIELFRGALEWARD